MDDAIFFDSGPLASRPLTGIGRYAARLALSLRKKCRVRFFTGGYESLVPTNLAWDQDQDLAKWSRRVWRGRRIPLDVPAGACAVYPGPRDGVRRFSREIGVLYDFTTLILPSTHAQKTRATFSRFFADGLLANDCVVAISEATKADARWLSDMPPDRIQVVYPGASLCVEQHLHREPVARVENRILSVSTLEPRKNAAFLFDWFAKTDALPPDAELWWVGPIGWLTSRRALSRYKKASRRRIRFLGMVSDKELCRLYKSCGTTIYPSLYEGFGFPVLDSLRHGARVLASMNSSLAEFHVSGIAFFDPCDPKTLDQAWAASRSMTPAGLDELDSIYSWDRTADLIIEQAASDAARAKPQPAASMSAPW